MRFKAGENKIKKKNKPTINQAHNRQSNQPSLEMQSHEIYLHERWKRAAKSQRQRKNEKYHQMIM